MGLAEHVKLLPESAADRQQAQLALFQQRDSKFQQSWQSKRRKVMTESIFGSNAGAQNRGVSSLPAAVASGSKQVRGSLSAGGSMKGTASQQLQERLLSVKRRKQLQSHAHQ